MYSTGYIALVGRANAGKSTLINALVGEQVSIVSSKPQTTRDNILGILNGENYQIIFVDTPGVHHSKNHLDRAMMKNVRSAIAGVDILLYLLDSTRPTDQEEIDYIKHLKEQDVDVLVLKTKCDKKQVCEFDCDMEISALTGENIDKLKLGLLEKLPKSETKNFLYEEDMYTDKSLRFLVAEKIREVALQLLKEEIPHGIAVQIEKFEENENLTVIEANLICEQERHKGIIIGKGGQTLKTIGEQARKFTEQLLGQKVFLKIFVKVEKDWRHDLKKVSKLGY